MKYDEGVRRGKGLRRWRWWGREDKKTGKTSKKDKRIKGGENEMRGMMEGGRLRGREAGDRDEGEEGEERGARGDWAWVEKGGRQVKERQVR